MMHIELSAEKPTFSRRGNHCKTRIDYTDSSLVLLVKQLHESQWTQVSSSSEVSPLRCCLCATIFENLPSLDDHIRAEHYSLVCTVCDKTLWSKPDVNLHKHKYHGTLSEKEQHPLAQVHRNDHHEAPAREMLNEATAIIATLTCNLCNHLFTTKHTLQDHNRSQHGADATFKCSRCDKLFSSKSDLEQQALSQHVRRTHGLPTPQFQPSHTFIDPVILAANPTHPAQEAV